MLGRRVKIATFNINNVNRRLPNLLNVAGDGKAGRGLSAGAEGGRSGSSRKPRSGRRISCRLAGPADMERGCDPRPGQEPVLTRGGLAGRSDRQTGAIYRGRRERRADRLHLSPEWQPATGAEIRLQAGMVRAADCPRRDAFETDAPVVLAGDFNVVPTEFDIYPTKSWDKDALVQPAPRECFRRLLEQGWTDAIRTLHPKQPMYTFWHYLRNRGHAMRG